MRTGDNWQAMRQARMTRRSNGIQRASLLCQLCNCGFRHSLMMRPGVDSTVDIQFAQTCNRVGNIAACDRNCQDCCGGVRAFNVISSESHTSVPVDGLQLLFGLRKRVTSFFLTLNRSPFYGYLCIYVTQLVCSILNYLSACLRSFLLLDPSAMHK